VPTLATAAEYFFKEGALGKRMRPTVLLLVASALSRDAAPSAAAAGVDHSAPREMPAGARCVAARRLGAHLRARQRGAR
jgi:geranyl diphosphate synthase